jgi:hypothetical protein
MLTSVQLTIQLQRIRTPLERHVTIFVVDMKWNFALT